MSYMEQGTVAPRPAPLASPRGRGRRGWTKMIPDRGESSEFLAACSSRPPHFYVHLMICRKVLARHQIRQLSRTERQIFLKSILLPLAPGSGEWAPLAATRPGHKYQICPTIQRNYQISSCMHKKGLSDVCTNAPCLSRSAGRQIRICARLRWLPGWLGSPCSRGLEWLLSPRLMTCVQWAGLCLAPPSDRGGSATENNAFFCGISTYLLHWYRRDL